MKKISLKEWANLNGISPSTVRHKIRRGKIHTAEKIGRDWFIDPDEKNVDHRYKDARTTDNQ